MDDRRRAALGVTLVFGIFLAVQLAALALVEPFRSAGYQPVENPQDPTNSLAYVLAILVMTGVMLLAFRYGVEQFIRLLIVGSGVWIGLYVFGVIVPDLYSVGGVNVLAAGLALSLGVGLLVHPEWYVIDAAGVVMGGGAAGLFGITFGVLPALVLLTVLAVYDAISVYGTEHMLTLASGVMDLKVPVVLVIPMSAGYSFLDTDDAGAPAEAAKSDGGGVDDAPDAATDGAGEGGPSDDGATDADEEATGADEGPLDRDALFVGLGDAVIPTVLVASAAFFLPASIPTIGGVPVPAVTAMVGTFAGLAALLWMVLKGRAHAGLPLLNGGTIAGYLVGALAAGMSLVEALAIGGYL